MNSHARSLVRAIPLSARKSATPLIYSSSRRFISKFANLALPADFPKTFPTLRNDKELKRGDVSGVVAEDPLLSCALDALSADAPCFSVEEKNVDILPSPDAFYQEILRGIASAQHRIVISALYIGTGARERAIFAALSEALERSPSLHVLLMFDWARGSRIDSTGQSSNTMCLNLADKFGSRVTTSFLHAPVHGKVDTDLPKPKSVVLPGQATVCTTVPAAQPGSAFNQPPPAPLQALRAAAGFARNFLPGRLGELFAVHHAKLYLFDDRVILSGANASEVYFHQRHDRYWGVTDGPLCNWLVAFATTVAMSKHARVAVGGVTAYETPEHWIYSPHWSPYARHKTGVAPARAQTDPLLHCVAEDVLMSQQAVSELKLEVEDTATVASLRALMQASHAKQPTDAARAADAASGRVLVIPALEWGAMGIRHDSAMQQALLECVAACKASLTIATGYFNPRRRDVAAWRALGKQTDVTVVTGSALSNGWGDAKGVTAQVPLLYNEVIRKCMRKWRNTNVQLREFIKPNWSFHAKGWWASSGKGVVTVLGSSNYNVRSAERDNELQFYVLIPEGPLARAVEKERQECIDGSQAALGKPEAHWAAKMLLPILRRFM